jgi:hypothetical protein
MLKVKPVDDDGKKEAEEPRPSHIVSFLIDNEYELVDKPALLRQRPVLARADKQ